MLLRAFPDAPLRRVHLGIDSTVFHPHSENRQKRIAYMPRRGLEDAQQVIAILNDRGLPEDWKLAPLEGLSHEAVADELRKSQIFLAFTRVEGFGLPAAEAMACGCYVIGNDGFAGREFFRSEFSTRIEAGDIVGFVDALEAAFGNVAVNPRWCLRVGEMAADFIHANYSPARERETVIALYADAIAAPHDGGSTSL
jgi:glycosyltransferase involved in cell wall biosynthesis